ncbi:MAG: hypothetical protein KC503_32670 [Myxococcales bacterium]|nr:hypothetical protein [Myxococcales bacterium]
MTPRHARYTWWLFVAAVAVLQLSCSSTQVRRFALADPLWEDSDRNAVSKRPGEYYTGLASDVADKTVFRPLSRLFLFDFPGDAKNVNAIDEVPNSSWFTNRIGLFNISPERAAQGACEKPQLTAAKGPWMVINAKPNGANPGFFIKTPQGRFLLKFDGPVQPQRATAADVIGSRIYWTAGYWAPCNQIVYFPRGVLKISPKATATNAYGEKKPITQADVDKVLSMAWRTKGGILRASASAFLPGRPIGPFMYNDTHSGDPNDIIRHDERRELRGARVLAAWLNHFDAREQNTLDIWVKAGKDKKRTYIRHYYIDFGDCFGSRWPWDGISRRLGYSYYMDFEHLLGDLVTLGAWPRPWNKAKINDKAEIFGYFGVERFEPSKWRVAYPNPSFDRMQLQDALWMTRIIERFTRAHITAMVKQGKLTNKRAEKTLIDVLMARRRKILAEYLTKGSPLDKFRIVRRVPGDLTQSLCFKDLAVKHKIVDYRNVLYKFRFMGGKKLDQRLGWLQFEPDREHPDRSCVRLPLGDKRPAELAPKGAPDNHPLRYGMLEIFVHQKPTLPPSSSIKLHFYDLGPTKGFRLVGIERPDKPVMPDLY